MGVGEKGYLSLELTAHGTGGHSARPTRDLALPRLSPAVLNVVSRPFVSDLDDIQRAKLDVLAPLVPFFDRMGLPTVADEAVRAAHDGGRAGIGGDSAHHDLADHLERGRQGERHSADRRRADQFPAASARHHSSVTAHVRDAINDPKVDVTERTETKHEASKIVGLNDPAYLYLSRTIKEAFALPIAPELMTGATDFVPLPRHRAIPCCVFAPSLPTPTIWYACTAPMNTSRSMISAPRSASTCALCAS